MRDRQDIASGTLERLNDALSSLENRIGIANRPVNNPARTNERANNGDVNALSAIRARQNALAQPARSSMPTPQQFRDLSGSNLSANLLREELNALRSQMEQQLSGTVNTGFQNIRNEMRAQMQAPTPAPSFVSAATLELRQDIAALKDDVAKLAREDTLQDMLERWGVLEREIAQLPEKVGSRDDLFAMVERLDHVQNAIAILPQSNNLSDIEQQVRALAIAVERLAQNSDVVNYPLESIDMRFDELSRAVAALPSQSAIDPNAFDRIEARIATLSNQLDARVATPLTHGLEDQLTELTAGLNQLREEARQSSSADALADLSSRIDDISEYLVAQSSNAVPSIDTQTAADMNERLIYIIDQLNNTEAAAEKTAKLMVASFDQKMDEIAKRIDENERNAATVPSIDTLEMRLDEIAQILSSGGLTAQTSPNDQMSSLEAQVMALTNSLNGSTTGIDEEKPVKRCSDCAPTKLSYVIVEAQAAQHRKN
ncbi:MAG: hypothetical protein U5K75_08900 [Ahrensia sp.]|nr:hypothetical protein [Ahrensia sp.]